MDLDLQLGSYWCNEVWFIMLLKFIGQIKAYFKLIQQKKNIYIYIYIKFEIIRHCMRIYSTCDYVTIKESIFSSMKSTYYLFLFYDCDLYVFYILYLIFTKNTILFTPNIQTQI